MFRKSCKVISKEKNILFPSGFNTLQLAAIGFDDANLSFYFRTNNLNIRFLIKQIMQIFVF